MALKIINNHGVLEIKGSIINKNVQNVKNHFENMLSKYEQVIVSLDYVQNIDQKGVEMLTKMYNNAMKINKVFYIIGKENKIVRNAFGKSSYVLKSDFV